MKHGIISDNLKAFLGGYAGMFAYCFKPFLLDTPNWFREGFFIGCAVFFLKMLGLALTSLVAGGFTALGADVVKNWRSYAIFKNTFFKKTKKDDRPQDETGADGRGDRAA